MLLTDLVTIVGDYLKPQPIPAATEDPDTKDQIHQAEIELPLATYQYHSTQLMLYKVMCGKVPEAFKQTEERINAIRLRTEQLEDWTILQCFLRDCPTQIFIKNTLLQEEIPNATSLFANFNLQLCLRHPNSYSKPICPLAARVERFLRLSYTSRFFHTYFYNESKRNFLPVTPNEPVDILARSIVSTYIKYDRVMASDLLNYEGVKASLSEQKSIQTLAPSHHVTSISLPKRNSLVSLALTGFIVLNTALKITLVMSTTVLLYTVMIPALTLYVAVKIDITAFRYVWRYILPIAALGALGGFLFSAYKTRFYIQNVWQARRHSISLHEESFSTFKRLWVDHTRALGIVRGTHQFFSSLCLNRVPAPSIVRKA